MAASKELKFVVVTPEKKVAEETAEAVVIPMHDGELGILPDRAALMCELGVGQMRYTKAGRTRRLYIDGGFAQVHENVVTVLTSRAVPAEEITDKMIVEAETKVKDDKARREVEAEVIQRAQKRVSVLRELRTEGK
jgi:F-type H+-transporting ATPase subunit epsilon